MKKVEDQLPATSSAFFLNWESVSGMELIKMAIVEGQEIKIKWNNRLEKHYVLKGYPKIKPFEYFVVKIEDLPENSNHLVTIYCDVCGTKKEKQYKEARSQRVHFCSKKCRNEYNVYSKEHLINEFLRFFDVYGKYPQQMDMQVKKGFPSHYYYTKIWGSWDNFINEMDIKSGNGRWLKEDIETLKQFYEQYPKEFILEKLINKYHWSNICSKARKLGLSRKYKKPSKKALSKEFLISEFWRYYKEFGKYPYRKDLKENKDYPSESGYMRLWGTWENFLKDINVISKENTDGWYITDENILKRMYEYGSQKEILDSLMVKRNWDTVKKKAKVLGLKRSNSTRRKHTKEELTSLLKNLAAEIGRTPRDVDIRNKPNFPSAKVFSNAFGGWNDALRDAGLTINAEFNISKEEIITRVFEFYNKNKRSPYWNELGFSRTVYQKYWSKFPDILEELGLPLNKKTREDKFKTDQELIDDYRRLYEILGRIPVANDVNNTSEMASFSTYKLRFGGYKEIWDKCGIDSSSIVDETTYGFICLDKNGDVCKSYAEMIITNLLIENHISYEKEYSYRKLIPNLKGKSYVMDWYLPDYKLCVEYFGMYRKDQLTKKGKIGDYTRKAEKKKEILKNNNQSLISLYQEDLNETYLQRVVNKFAEIGIEISVLQKNLYKNNPDKSVV